MRQPDERSIYCVYSDDLRDEIGGKSTIIGWYPEGGIFMPPEGPLLLQKLCILALVTSPIDRPFKTLRIQVSLGSNILQAIDVPEQAVVAMSQDSKPIKAQVRNIHAKFALQILNFVVNEPGVLEVTVIADGKELKANPLEFVRTD